MTKNRIKKSNNAPKTDGKIAVERGNLDIVALQLLNSINLNLANILKELKIANGE